MSEAGKKIIAGLKDALAYARGDKSRGKATIVYVTDNDHAETATIGADGTYKRIVHKPDTDE